VRPDEGQGSLLALPWRSFAVLDPPGDGGGGDLDAEVGVIVEGAPHLTGSQPEATGGLVDVTVAGPERADDLVDIEASADHERLPVAGGAPLEADQRVSLNAPRLPQQPIGQGVA
jgi:hypothetical protein